MCTLYKVSLLVSLENDLKLWQLQLRPATLNVVRLQVWWSYVSYCVGYTLLAVIFCFFNVVL